MVNQESVDPLMHNDPLLELTGYVLQRAASTNLARLSQRLAPLELRPADVALLFLVASRPGLTQSEIGRNLDIQRANMVPLVARLEKRGLVSRKRVDGRSQSLTLTREGRALVTKVRKVVESHESALLNRVPPEMQPMVLPILTALWGEPPTSKP